MRYLLTLAVAAAALGFAGIATADAAIRASFVLEDITFQEQFLSDACGTDVFLTLNGTIKAMLFVDKTGAIVREVDTQPAGTLTYSNSAGESLSFPWTIISRLVRRHHRRLGGVADADRQHRPVQRVRRPGNRTYRSSR
jgi:hypothetical protein